MSEVTLRSEPSSDLAIGNEQTFWNDKQRAALVQLGVDPQVSDADLAVFFHQVARTGLDPFARQIYMIGRWSREGTKQTIQTGIDGFRLIARRATDHRNGTFGYLPTEWCGGDGQWRDVWLQSGPPAASRVTVIRDGAHFPAVALFTEYAGTKKGGELTQMWATKGALMLAKCAEALALRKAFPQDLSGLYTGDEMQASTNDRPAQMPQTGRDVLATALAAPEPQDEPEAVDNIGDAPEAPEPSTISDAQRKKLMALANDLGLTREQRLAGCTSVTERDVASTNDLTRDEAKQVIDRMETRLADTSDVIEAELVDAEPDALPEPTEAGA